jgi:Zn-dependent protease with chaperone function
MQLLDLRPNFMRLTAILTILASTLLGACATTSSPEGRAQIVVPTEVSAVYSEVDMRLKLVAAVDTTADAPASQACQRTGCDTPYEFERKVLQTGARLSASAFRLFPDLEKRVAKFDFAVANKADSGTVSNAAGAIVVLDGVRRLGLSDEALSFVIAREMGHVIARHHDEDSATNMMFSVAAGLLFPIANLIRGVAVALPTSAAVSATTTAASLAGSSIARASYRGSQISEADAIALQLLTEDGSELHDVAATLDANALRGDDRWLRELRGSYQRLDQLACGPRRQLGKADVELSMSMSLLPFEPAPGRQ